MKKILFGIVLILLSIYGQLAAIFMGWYMFDAISACIAILGLIAAILGLFENGS
jgi:hypothetical protein